MMKWTQQKPIACIDDTALSFELYLPEGLIGMNELKRFRGIIEKDMPFIELRSLEEAHLGFWAMDPFPFVDHYSIEISDDDVDALGIKEGLDGFFLTLATMNKSNITLNLMAPILINRKTQQGKQVVLGNYKNYSARHVIYEGAIQCLS